MTIIKPRHNPPTANNQESDKVVVEGVCTAEDLWERGQLAGQQTIEALKRMYPKSTELEAKELELMNNQPFVDSLRAACKENKEKIDSIYSNQRIKDTIKQTRDKINQLSAEYEKTKQNNILYEKDKLIRELQEKLNEKAIQ